MRLSKMQKRIFMSAVGVLTCGVSVGIFKLAALGVDPFQVLMSGLDAVIPIPFGTLYVIVNLLLLLFSFLFDRHYIGIATVINLTLLGYVSEFTRLALLRAFPALSLPARFVCLLIGLVILCFASSIYFTADLGVSPYDAISLVAAYKWKAAPFQYCRIASDLLCVAAGAALWLFSGGTWAKLPTVVGIGTIITAFFMGPVIEFFNVHLMRPFLYGKQA